MQRSTSTHESLPTPAVTESCYTPLVTAFFRPQESVVFLARGVLPPFDCTSSHATPEGPVDGRPHRDPAHSEGDRASTKGTDVLIGIVSGRGESRIREPDQEAAYVVDGFLLDRIVVLP